MALDESTLQQLLATLERFVSERLVPLEAQIAEEDHIPEEVVAEMRSLGLFGMTIPEEYGGLGLNTLEECRAIMVLGNTAPAFRSVFGTN
ncbi:MAG: acyl-CoA dehydrogenase family protein, partial [Pseudomonadales bacterium]